MPHWCLQAKMPQLFAEFSSITRIMLKRPCPCPYRPGHESMSIFHFPDMLYEHHNRPFIEAQAPHPTPLLRHKLLVKHICMANDLSPKSNASVHRQSHILLNVLATQSQQKYQLQAILKSTNMPNFMGSKFDKHANFKCPRVKQTCWLQEQESP